MPVHPIPLRDLGYEQGACGHIYPLPAKECPVCAERASGPQRDEPDPPYASEAEIRSVEERAEDA